LTELGPEEGTGSGSRPADVHHPGVPQASLLSGVPCRGDPEHEKPLKIVGEILQPDLCLRPHPANRPNQLAPHRHGAIVKSSVWDVAYAATGSLVVVSRPSVN
jgi:hypothetical protein